MLNSCCCFVVLFFVLFFGFSEYISIFILLLWVQIKGPSREMRKIIIQIKTSYGHSMHDSVNRFFQQHKYYNEFIIIKNCVRNSVWKILKIYKRKDQQKRPLTGSCQIYITSVVCATQQHTIMNKTKTKFALNSFALSIQYVSSLQFVALNLPWFVMLLHLYWQMLCAIEIFHEMGDILLPIQKSYYCRFWYWKLLLLL